MANKMLIDASHPEETRVVVLRGNRVEEFDFEAASRKQLRGNIYLAKVTRVEPSLQAAFVEYGGNRHGFLAFAEIHPDYYQIPVADRQALLEEEARAHSDESEDEGRNQRHSRRNRSNGGDRAEKRRTSGDAIVSEALADDGQTAEHSETGHAENRDETAAEHGADDANEGDRARTGHLHEAGEQAPASSEPDVDENGQDEPAITTLGGSGGDSDAAPGSAESEGGSRDEGGRGRNRRDRNRRGGRGRDEARSDKGGGDNGEEGEAEAIEHMGGDAMEELPYRAPRLRRQYKIQEVIKRRQVLLIQVVKEERGNKGAALTTYLSLAGRYSVLMPNTARGGGISRKITDTTDRKRLKEIVQDLEVPEGMGIILRTAGASRTKPEVKRDFEYLLRMWETVRELTLKSSAPMLVYEEGSLIKRAIRDLYNKDIDEVVVAGDDGYREAKEFMRLLMPSHAKNVKPYKDPQPIFAKSGAEAQLDAMFSSQVTLKSGGYIVINQTEALVAIDVNSGRSTREHNIEDTAVRTNLEAADEVARQLRLRDLAGLIVVDFIDMDENRNNRSVERRMKDALANDRARIQVGRISHFGLLEMSRQRIRTGVLEGSTVPCPHCAGIGMVRSKSSIALHVMRVLEDALIKNASYHMTVRTRTEVALYILNQKRNNLRELETRFGVTVTVAADDTLTGAIYHAMERGEPVLMPDGQLRPELVRVDSIQPAEIEAEAEEIEAEVEEEVVVPAPSRKSYDRPREDRPRQERQREERPRERAPDRNAEAPEGRPGRGPERPAENAGDESEQSRRRRRRRRRRGGQDRENVQNFAPGADQPQDDGLAMLAEINGDLPVNPALATEPRGEGEPSGSGAEAATQIAAEAGAPDVAPRRSRRVAAKKPARDAVTDAAVVEAAAPAEPAAEMADAKPKRGRRPAKPKVGAMADAPAERVEAVAAAQPVPAPERAASQPAAPLVREALDVMEAPVEAAIPRAEALPEAAAGPKRSGWWSRVKNATIGGN